MPENPRPIRLPGEPAIPQEPYADPRYEEVTGVVDADFDLFGAEAAAADLSRRLAAVEQPRVRHDAHGDALLWPPYAPARDHVDGPPTGPASLVVFGAFGTPWSRVLGHVLGRVRDRYPSTVCVVWRHFPDPVAHPRAVMMALAAEAAGTHGRFWALTREFLARRHDDPSDLHIALVRAGLDPQRTIAEMRAGIRADRIADDVESAGASGVTYAPALFINGEHYVGELSPRAVAEALAPVWGA
jgi:Thioredoxin